MPADRSQKRQAVIGAIAVASTIIVFLLIFFLADLRQLLTPTDDLFVQMPSAAGLRAGSPVWIAGQTVGEVKRIEVRPPSVDSTRRVSVQIEVASRHREHIRRDSGARVTSAGLMGDPVLDITPGSASTAAIAPNDTLRFRVVGSPEAALASARSLQAGLQELLAEARTVSNTARARSAQAARLRDQLAVLGREFETFVHTVREGPLNTFSDPEFKQIVHGVSASLAELRTRFTQAAERARAVRSDAEPSLRRLTARIDTISRGVQQLQRAIEQSGGGLLVRAQTDTAIIKALHGAQAQLDSLIAETRRNPLRFWF